jgi:hypothetical protein
MLLSQAHPQGQSTYGAITTMNYWCHERCAFEHVSIVVVISMLHQLCASPRMEHKVWNHKKQVNGLS